MDGAAGSSVAASADRPRWRAGRPDGCRFLLGATAGLALVAATAMVAVPAAAAPSPSRTAATGRAAGNADRAAIEAARRFLCPHGGMPMRGGRCRGGGATASVIGRDMSVRDWDSGLPAAVRRQAPCPEGTVQGRVLFWEDAVRCLPR
jgi:hypothetical protein